jgi:hypothetical protein
MSLSKVFRREYRDVRETNLALREQFMEMVLGLREEHGPEVLARALAYFIVGSANQDYRSMIMDGEVAVVLAHRSAINGFFDSIGIAGVATYLDSVEELNQYLPYMTGMKWKLSRWIKVAL